MAMTDTGLRQSYELTDEEWHDLDEIGYVRLGVVLSEEEIDQLCDRIDDIMLGNIHYEGMRMQLCPSAGEGKKGGFSPEHKGSSLKYRKIQELEMEVIGPRF